MTLTQGAEIARLAKAKGYVVCVSNGKVQFQVLNADGSVALEVTDWIDCEEAKELLTQE